MNETVVINGDALDIVRRIKGIDKGYFVIYNRKLRRYEVHHKDNRQNTLAVVIPYRQLDNRAYELVKKTRRERIKELIAEIERDNLHLEKSWEKSVIDDAVKNFEEKS